MRRLAFIRGLSVVAGFICLLLPDRLAGPVVATWGRWTIQVADVVGLGLIVLWNILYLVGLALLFKYKSGQSPKV